MKHCRAKPTSGSESGFQPDLSHTCSGCARFRDSCGRCQSEVCRAAEAFFESQYLARAEAGHAGLGRFSCEDLADIIVVMMMMIVIITTTTTSIITIVIMITIIIITIIISIIFLLIILIIIVVIMTTIN